MSCQNTSNLVHLFPGRNLKLSDYSNLYSMIDLSVLTKVISLHIKAEHNYNHRKSHLARNSFAVNPLFVKISALGIFESIHVVPLCDVGFRFQIRHNVDCIIFPRFVYIAFLPIYFA